MFNKISKLDRYWFSHCKYTIFILISNNLNYFFLVLIFSISFKKFTYLTKAITVKTRPLSVTSQCKDTIFILIYNNLIYILLKNIYNYHKLFIINTFYCKFMYINRYKYIYFNFISILFKFYLVNRNIVFIFALKYNGY